MRVKTQAGSHKYRERRETQDAGFPTAVGWGLLEWVEPGDMDPDEDAS